MANIQLPNDVVRTYPLVTKDAAGDVVTPPAGIVYTAVSSDPASLNAVVTDANVAVNALVRTASGVTLTVDDNGPLAAMVYTFDIVDDVVATSVAIDELNATDVPQAVPGPTPPAP